jgi:multidrug efflux pump subunit AcrA (membrane-fusion protein)
MTMPYSQATKQKRDEVNAELESLRTTRRTIAHGGHNEATAALEALRTSRADLTRKVQNNLRAGNLQRGDSNAISILDAKIRGASRVIDAENH